MMQVQDKVVWITGASSGIGEAMAYEFAKQGAKLVLSARREIELERVKANCTGASEVTILAMDMTQIDLLQSKVEQVMSMMGRIDVLVLNAGISQRSLAKETTLEVYRKIMEINYFATIQLALAVLPHFLQQNKGQYVVISSVTGKAGLPVRTAYSASKHAVEGFFSSLRVELWKTGIKMLVVRPGAVKTNIAANALKGDGRANNEKDETIEKGMNPSVCAKGILNALKNDRNEVVIGSIKEKAFYHLNKFVPGLVFNIIKKMLPIEK